MLKIANATLGYGKKPVLHIKELAIEKGQHTLITGNSGSGKTTLLYTIAGLLPALHGSISIAGQDITQLSESGRDRFRARNIGVIFQTLHLVRSLSVIDNLMLGYYAAGVRQDKANAEAMLKKLGILEKKHALPRAISQGQAQRVAIARALLGKPALLLADEPTSSLDDESCERVITLIIQAAHESGAALLISTHDSRVKAHFTHRIHLENLERSL
jgi:putative ABC transport system ATP-binding protein